MTKQSAVVDLDALRTDLHERAVIVMAKKRGEDPETALASRRHLQQLCPGRDLRLSIAKARYVIERETGRGYKGR